MDTIYLDYNATTPILDEVADAMTPHLRGRFGNPSSSHRFGLEARAAVERAREQVAGLLNSSPDEVIFTSGGSEANNLALKGFAFRHRDRGRHIVTTTVEHPAVLEVCSWLETQGFEVTRLPVDAAGVVAPRELERVLRADTILVSVMLANNEVGTIEPVRELAAVARARGIAVHTDAAQAVGKIPVDVRELGVDLLSVAGHKMYAPKGVGVLYRRRGVELEKVMHGAAHEQNIRAGTENVLEIVGLGKAAEVLTRGLAEHREEMARLRDRLQQGLLAKALDCRVNGHPVDRLPNTLSISFRGVDAGTLMAEVDHIACSAGAACHSDKVTMSHVLAAMAVPADYAMGTLRLTVGRMTTEREVDTAAEAIGAAAVRLQGKDAETLEHGSGDGPVRLTRYTHGLGCACKLRPQALEKILAALPRSADPNVLVGTETSDDAAVYRVSEELAIVQTVDFFTPIVDDPYQFGAIAAANSLSDIYAMGARPLFALSIVGFPSNRLPMSVLHEILRGAADKAAEAGISIIGGHSVDDTEPKYGLAVTGSLDPRRILTNNRARPGDKLVLTKPIGTGIVTTAIKRGLADPGLTCRVTAIMACLNAAAADATKGLTVTACTDVTGFGLLGHLHEMTAGSGVDALVDSSKVPIIREAVEFARAGVVPGGTENNSEYVSPHVSWGAAVPPEMRLLLCDAQTSGGLLIAVDSRDAEGLLTSLHSRGVTDAAVIGVFTEPGSGRISVL